MARGNEPSPFLTAIDSHAHGILDLAGKGIRGHKDVEVEVVHRGERGNVISELDVIG